MVSKTKWHVNIALSEFMQVKNMVLCTYVSIILHFVQTNNSFEDASFMWSTFDNQENSHLSLTFSFWIVLLAFHIHIKYGMKLFIIQNNEFKENTPF